MTRDMRGGGGGRIGQHRPSHKISERQLNDVLSHAVSEEGGSLSQNSAHRETRARAFYDNTYNKHYNEKKTDSAITRRVRRTQVQGLIMYTKTHALQLQ